MESFLAAHRRLLTVVLALIGIGAMVAYLVCLGACSYLKGSILGLDLKYLGIAYMGTVLVLGLWRKPLLCLLLLAFGAGGEIFLVGYQVRAGVYCPYCLTFGVTVILALIVNFDPARKGLAALAAAAGLGFFLLFFSGATTPAYAAELPLAQYGKGPVEVRVYTDYFCGPCRAEEPEVAALLTELGDKNAIRVLFIDTPIHKETIPYAGCFLAALQAKKGDLRHAIAVRSALFEAAEKKVAGKEAVESFLAGKGIALAAFDPAPAFKLYGNYLQEDKIDSTPSCVIIGPKGKQTFVGSDDIRKALRALLPGK